MPIGVPQATRPAMQLVGSASTLYPPKRPTSRSPCLFSTRHAAHQSDLGMEQERSHLPWWSPAQLGEPDSSYCYYYCSNGVLELFLEKLGHPRSLSSSWVFKTVFPGTPGPQLRGAGAGSEPARGPWRGWAQVCLRVTKAQVDGTPPWERAGSYSSHDLHGWRIVLVLGEWLLGVKGTTIRHVLCRWCCCPLKLALDVLSF